MQLSKHFSLKEMCITSVDLSNEPEPEHMIALHTLAYGMENIRHILGDKPIRINSGYRNRKVNAAVGGVSNSDHALGYACDFQPVSGLTAKVCCEIIIASGLLFDQLILERNDRIIHISFNPRLREQILRQPGGPGTPFTNGLD